jgi:hypothetical protein
MMSREHGHAFSQRAIGERIIVVKRREAAADSKKDLTERYDMP